MTSCDRGRPATRDSRGRSAAAIAVSALGAAGAACAMLAAGLRVGAALPHVLPGHRLSAARTQTRGQAVRRRSRPDGDGALRRQRRRRRCPGRSSRSQARQGGAHRRERARLLPRHQPVRPAAGRHRDLQRHARSGRRLLQQARSASASPSSGWSRAQSIDMAVSFFVSIRHDRRQGRRATSTRITLSYTFFPVDEARKVSAAGAGERRAAGKGT